MKDDDAARIISIPPTATATTKKDGPDGFLFGKTRYKFWVLSAILLLAFWSMFTGTVTLKWSTGNLFRLADDLDLPSRNDDLDILEVEERAKLVRHMWDIYTHSSATKLPRFWQRAFEAAYDALASDVPSVRGAAVSEIAKLSLRSFNNSDPIPLQSTPNTNQKKKKKSPMQKRKTKRSSQ